MVNTKFCTFREAKEFIRKAELTEKEIRQMLAEIEADAEENSDAEERQADEYVSEHERLVSEAVAGLFRE